MRGVIKIVPVILILLAAGATAQDFNLYGFNAIDYSLLGAGARARAMGGAFVGLADDASALTWNPAGLVQIQKTQTSVSGTYVKLKQTTDLNSRNFSVQADDKKLKLSYASFVAPLRLKGHPFMASAAFHSAEDQLQDWYSWAQVEQTYVPPADTNTYAYTAERYSETNITGGLDVFSFGFGTGLYGNLAIGGAINIYNGSGVGYYRSSYIDTVYTQLAGVSDTIQLERTFRVDDEIKQKGVNFTGSFFYQLEKFQAGFVVRTPFDLITEHTFTRRDTVFENGLPTFPNINKGWIYNGKSRLEMPLTLSGGIAVTPTPNLVLSGDFEMQKWSNSKYKVERDTSDLFVRHSSLYFPHGCADYDTCDVSHFTNAGDKIEVYDEFGLDLQNSTQFRFGGEYMLISPVGNIPLRAGFRIVKRQYTDVSNLQYDELGQVIAGFVLGDQVSNKTVTFGSGIHWRQIWLDFAVELSKETQTFQGSDYLGTYEISRERNNPSATFNFTGFF